MYSKGSIIVLFIMLLSGAFAITDAYYLLSVESSAQKPLIAYPGDTINLAVTLINNGKFNDANNIRLELVLPENFSPSRIEENIGFIKPKEKKTVVFQFESSKSTKPGTYNLSLKLEYDNAGTMISDTEYLSITISELNRIAISNLSVSNYFPHIGEHIFVSADVENDGSLDARNVSVELSMVGSINFSGFIVLSDTLKELGNIKAGESKKVSFELKASDAASPGLYTFSLKANCTDCGQPKEQKFSLHLYGKPELIISGIDYSVEGRNDKKITQGDTIALSVQLDNLGKENAKRTVVSIETDDSLIGPKSAYIGEIESEDSGSAIFDLAVSETAQVGYHDVKIKITYLDELQKEQTIEGSYKLYVFKAPEPSPYMHYIFIIVILILVYIILKLIIRQLAIRKL